MQNDIFVVVDVMCTICTMSTNLNKWINGLRTNTFEILFNGEMEFIASATKSITLQKFRTSTVRICNGFVDQYPISIDQLV